MTQAAPPRPVKCTTMDEVRAQIDRMDQMIVPLLAERLCYIAQAAAIKPTRADVVVPWRIEDVVSKAKARAAECDMDLATIETIYRALIDASIAFEGREWDAINATKSSK